MDLSPFSVGSPGSPCEHPGTAIRIWLGYCTLGWASTPTTPAEGRRITLQAIHPPLIDTSNAPTSTVRGVLLVIAAATTRPSGYINTAAVAQMAPAHLGSVPERQTATPSSTLPTKLSRT